jgi:AcrR family transcriptional regulator
MPRAGLNRRRIAEAAAELVDREGIEALSLSRLATSLGVRSPSLYNHVDGLEGLRREVAIVGMEQLGEVTRDSVMGAGGVEGLRTMARAYRRYALEHPGVYALTQQARPGDAECAALSFRVLEPLLSVLAGFGLGGEAAIHAARALRSALHGFVSLEATGGFGIELDTGTSFEFTVDVLVAGIRSPDLTGAQANSTTSAAVRPVSS